MDSSSSHGRVTVLGAWRDGIGRVAAAPVVLLGMYGLSLFVALPLAIALRGMIAGQLGGSLFADTLASDTSYEWWQEFSAQATGLGTTFVPSIIGFGAVLSNLSGLLDNLPMATTIAGATIAWLVLWSFLSGGVLDRYARMRATRANGFFSACGTHVWRFLRLGVLAFLVYGALFGVLHAWLFDVVYHVATADFTSERSAFVVRLFCYAIFGSALILVNVIFDYARIRIVVEDRRSAVGALVAGARFVRRHPGSYALYALNGLCFVLLALVYAVVAPGAPAGAAIWLALLIGQIYILLRHFVKLAFYATQIAYFQSNLAHAAYTAAPPVVWPDSPAAESIGNA